MTIQSTKLREECRRLKQQQQQQLPQLDARQQQQLPQLDFRQRYWGGWVRSLLRWRERLRPQRQLRD